MFDNKLRIPLILTLFIVLLSIFPKTVLADSGPFRSANFKIDVKPEYDDPQDRTLVIYQSDFTNPGPETIKKGTPVSFVIPKGADIGMACEINAQGGHECQPYVEKDLGGNKVQLTWKITKEIAPNQKYPTYLEFYYNNGSTPPEKTFTYQFTPLYDMDNLLVNIAAPKAAVNFTTDPAAMVTKQDSDGLKDYIFNYNNRKDVDALRIKVTYHKEDNKPTFDKPQTGPSPSATAPGSSGNWLSKPEFLLPALLLTAILIAGLIFGLDRKTGVKRIKPSSGGGMQVGGLRSGLGGNLNTESDHSEERKSEEKKQLRQMLLDGRISEQTYLKLAAELDQEDKYPGAK